MTNYNQLIKSKKVGKVLLLQEREKKKILVSMTFRKYSENLLKDYVRTNSIKSDQHKKLINRACTKGNFYYLKLKDSILRKFPKQFLF